MNNKDYEARIQELEGQVKVLQEANVNLINRNMQLGQMVDAYYDVRRRIEMLKDLVIRHKELLKEADLRDDDDTPIPTSVSKNLLISSAPPRHASWNSSDAPLSTSHSTTISTTCAYFVRCSSCRRNPRGASLPVPRRPALPSSAPSTANFRTPSV